MLRGIHKLCDKARWSDAVDLLAKDTTGEEAKADCSTTGGWGEWTPLHLACKHDPPLGVASALLDAAPVAAETFDVHDHLPLHYLVEKGCSDVGVIDALVKTIPESAEVLNKDGETPIITSFRRAAASEPTFFPSDKEVEILAYATGEALLTEVDKEDGTILLHEVVKRGAPMGILRTLVMACPPSGAVPTKKDGHTPLMLAFNREREQAKFPSTDEVRLLANASGGEAAMLGDAQGKICLHRAVEEGAPMDILRALVEANPDTLTVKAPDGNNALSLAFSRTAAVDCFPEVEEIALLVDKPLGKAALIKDENGKACLQRSVDAGAPLNVLTALVKASPQSLTEVSADGETFMACGAPVETVEALVRAVPASVRIKDGRGRIALHHAIQSGKLSFVDFLIQAYHESIIAQDKNGSTPLHAALLFSEGPPVPFGVLEKLLGEESTALKIARIADNEGKLPLHCACQNLELVPPEVITKLIDLNPKAPSTKMKCGKLPIDLLEAKRNSITYTEDIEYLNTVSDLIFSYHPNVTPYRADPARLQRFKAKMLAELAQSDSISDESRRFWTWICTVPDRVDSNMQYGDTIESIMKSIKHPQTKKMLRNMEVGIPAGGYAPLSQCVSKRIVFLLSPPQKDVKQCLKDVAQKIRQAQSKGFLHGNVASFKIARRAEGGYGITSEEVTSNVRNGNYIGASHALISSGGLSPQMIASLDLDGYKKYRKYWKTVSDDAATYNILTGLSISRITDMVELYLPDLSNNATFADLLGRVTENNALWEKIRPKRHGSMFYAIKCFHENPITGRPVAPERLPYELVRAHEGHDLWSFGLVLQNVLTGTPLFDVDSSNNLTSGAGYASLFQWKAYGTGDTINDPIAANLLQMLFSPDTYTSPMPIDRILEHPYFSDSTAQARKEFLRILSRGKEQREKEWLVREEKRKQKEEDKAAETSRLWIGQRTEVLENVSLQTKVKFATSTWKQWGFDGESMLPTSFVLLPYKLEASVGGSLSVPIHDVKAAQQLGSSLAGVLLYVKLLHDMSSNQYRGKQIPASNALWRYNDLNKHIDASEDTFLGCCRSIVSRVDNAKDVLCSLLPATNDNSRSQLSSLLINTHIQGIVDVAACREMLEKASAAENAMQALLKSSGSKSIKSVQKAMGEQFDELLGVKSLRKQQAQKKASVEKALTKLVKTFSEDSFESVKQVLGEKVADLCSTYMTSRHCYLYLVDEVTGYPAREPSFLSAVTYPLKVDNSIPEDLAKLIPCMLPTLKAVCFSNAAVGLATILGLRLEQIPSSWSDVVSITPGGFAAFSTKRECEILYAASSCGNNSKRDDSNLFQHYMTTILSHDVRRDYGGMNRIRSPCGEFLWTGEVRGEVEQELEVAEITEYIEKNRIEAMEKVSALINSASASIEEGSDTMDRSIYERAFKCVVSSTHHNTEQAQNDLNRSTAVSKSFDVVDKILSPKKMGSTESHRMRAKVNINVNGEEEDSENNRTDNDLAHPPTPGRMFKQTMVKRGRRAFKSAGQVPF